MQTALSGAFPKEHASWASATNLAWRNAPKQCQNSSTTLRLFCPSFWLERVHFRSTATYKRTLACATRCAYAAVCSDTVCACNHMTTVSLTRNYFSTEQFPRQWSLKGRLLSNGSVMFYPLRSHTTHIHPRTTWNSNTLETRTRICAQEECTWTWA